MKINLLQKNEDGSVKCELTVHEKELVAIAQFGLNMAVSMGIMSQLADEDDEQLDLFDTEGMNPN